MNASGSGTATNVSVTRSGQYCQMSSTITVGWSSSTSNSTASGRTTPSRTVSNCDSPKSSGARASQKSISRTMRIRSLDAFVAVMIAWSFSSASGTQKDEMPHLGSTLRRISSSVRPVRVLRLRSISSALSGDVRPGGGSPRPWLSGRKNPITFPASSHCSTACVTSPRWRLVLESSVYRTVKKG